MNLVQALEKALETDGVAASELDSGVVVTIDAALVEGEEIINFPTEIRMRHLKAKWWCAPF